MCRKTAEEEPLNDVTRMRLPLNVVPSLFKYRSEANTKLAKIKTVIFHVFLKVFAFIYI